MRYVPHKYQSRAIDFVVKHPRCALFMDMGLGKTIVTLTALKTLREDYLEVNRVLVIAPKSVALNTWSGEASKWDHLKDLRVSIVMGSAAKRMKALDVEADLYVINRENVVWLKDLYLESGKPWPFDTVVLDESSSFKNFASRRFKAMWKVSPQISRLVELTGTPAPNGLMDLWSQVKLLDGGERLGKFITSYRTAYFNVGAHSGAVVYSYVPKAGSREKIMQQISDICLSMRASDYLDMPMVIDGGMELELPELKAYKRFEQESVAVMADEVTIVAPTLVALTNKLLQFASGAVYDDEHTWHEVSSAKVEALAELIEQTDEPVLVFYNYQHELERMKEVLKDYGPEQFKGEPERLKRWNEGKIRVLLCHPASVAYGLNMQQGGHIIVWYSPTWDLELYQQANARLNRQGQTKPIIIYHLICRQTMDEVVMKALKAKGNVQESIMNYLKLI